MITEEQISALQQEIDALKKKLNEPTDKEPTNDVVMTEQQKNGLRFKRMLQDNGKLPPDNYRQAKEISENRGVIYKDPWQN